MPHYRRLSDDFVLCLSDVRYIYIEEAPPRVFIRFRDGEMYQWGGEGAEALIPLLRDLEIPRYIEPE